MIQKLPFRDARNQWWIYRSDDPNMHRPLGPFFDPGYAQESEHLARARNGPLPSSFGPMPVLPIVERG